MGLDRAKMEMLGSTDLAEEMRCEYRYICIAGLCPLRIIFARRRTASQRQSTTPLSP